MAATKTAPDGKDGADRPVSCRPQNLFDGKTATAWRVAGDGTGVVITVRFRQKVHITSVGSLPGYAKHDQATGDDWFPQNRRVASVSWSVGDGHRVTQTFADRSELQTKTVDLTGQELTLTITGTRTPAGRNFTAISEILLRGIG